MNAASRMNTSGPFTFVDGVLEVPQAVFEQNLTQHIDEAPQAYKRVEEVITAQSELVEVLGQFQPQVVRMDSGNDI